jgi:hypothetical protein
VGDNTYTNTALTNGAQAITAIENRTHTITLNVLFSSGVTTLAFKDSNNNTITPLDGATPEAGKEICYLCEYSALQSKWVIMPIAMEA